MRPRFEVVVPRPAVQTLQGLRAALEQPGAPYVGSVVGKHVLVKVRPGERRLWSPQLEVDVEGHPDGTLLRGLFAPQPDVWTFFVALYAVIGLLGFAGLLFGLVQWWLGTTPVALWSVPAALVLGGAVYALALAGQRLSQAQIVQLRAFLDDAVGANRA
jgi:hypothetical protein